jgi:dienelactone hydrolase
MIEEKIIVGESGDFPLDGLLTLPDVSSDTETPVPAVVLVQGSGASDKDSSVYAIKPFKDLAEGLAQRGVAAIRYDKRSYTYGKEMLKNPALSVREETIDDAILAAQILKSDPRIDPEQIYILGLSMGAMLAPRIDAEGGDFAGLILLAGSTRRLEEIMKDQIEESMEKLNPFLKWIARLQSKKLLERLANLYELSDEEAQKTPIIGKRVNAYYFIEAGRKPATDYLEKLEKPVLVMYGDKDFHGSVEGHFEPYKKILAHNKQTRFKLYPGLNHVFMPSVYNDITKARKEYSVKQHVEVKVIDDIADWIKGDKQELPVDEIE